MHSSCSSRPCCSMRPFFFFCCLYHLLVENQCFVAPNPALALQVGFDSLSKPMGGLESNHNCDCFWAHHSLAANVVPTAWAHFNAQSIGTTVIQSLSEDVFNWNWMVLPLEWLSITQDASSFRQHVWTSKLVCRRCSNETDQTIEVQKGWWRHHDVFQPIMAPADLV